MPYGASWPDAFYRGAITVHKILKGAKPSGLPMEQPTQLEFIANFKTDSAFGITIPKSILQRADEVIKRARRAQQCPS